MHTHTPRAYPQTIRDIPLPLLLLLLRGLVLSHTLPTHRGPLIRSCPPPPGTAVRPWSSACCPHHPPRNLPPLLGGEKSFAIGCRLHLFGV